MHSAIYHGLLTHRRELAPAHSFVYRMRLFWLDLDEVATLFAAARGWSLHRFAPGWLRRRDYLRPETCDLKQAVCDEIAAQLGVRPRGPIRMLTAPRVWGIGFNPLTLYYCYGDDGGSLQFVLAEVRNTPWFERHCYALDLRDTGDSKHHQPADHDKQFHVSPFLPHDLRYHWKLNTPADTLSVQIRNDRAGKAVFRASLALQRHTALTPALLQRELWQHWPQGLKTLAGIYWQALKLVVKRARFYSHPGTPPSPAESPANQTQLALVETANPSEAVAPILPSPTHPERQT